MKPKGRHSFRAKGKIAGVFVNSIIKSPIMRKFSFLILILLSVSYAKASSSGSHIKGGEVLIAVYKSDLKISLEEYINLSPREYKKLTGRKLKLKEIILLKISQRQIRKHIRNTDNINLSVFIKKPKEQFKWHWGGFFLGMWFPIGLIIALSINDEKRKDRIRSALFGMAAALLIVLVVGILIAPIGI